ncbi:MAG: efflux RND transporter periplasmic adaptor subunit [Ignavibacteria bacterium]|nr:efflux RND transporter periplasmic adaptor subunit [Ignavibacteria bacterium]
MAKEAISYRKNRGRLVLAGGVLVVCLAALIFLVGGDGNASNEGPSMKEIVVERGVFQVVVTANGIVQPIDRVEIKSKASGEIVDLAVEEGDVVKKGDLIVRLDQKDERAALAQAVADLNIANAELQQAQRTFDRRERLYQSQLISEEERDEVELSLAVAKGKVIQATTTLDRTKERFEEAVVQSPINGVILQKYVEEGQIIASGVTNVSGGTPIVDVADMSSVHIEAGIDEIDIGKVVVGQPVRVIADAYPELSFEGSVVRLAPEARVDQNVTLFDVVVAVNNPERRLQSGMNTEIEIIIDRREDVLLIPTIALQPGDRGSPDGSKGSGATVLLKRGNEFPRHPIEIGPANFVYVVVLSGLDEGSILGVPMTSRLKEENERLEERIKSSRSFGTTSKSSTSR